MLNQGKREVDVCPRRESCEERERNLEAGDGKKKKRGKILRRKGEN